ncbi:hypothetical protein [Oceanobacillus rekensis]|uniref:hypothetical protein n=1 Tax=Oceanobacillus rekensis TaxID=937927 RepID=UPI000B436355|nr:hypothetical protein [Oceanobacillus rekensis]
MKSKNIILLLTIILSLCVISPVVHVQATSDNSSDIPPAKELGPEEPVSEKNVEEEPEPEAIPEPEVEEPIVPEPEESVDEKLDSSSDKDAQEDREEEQPKKPTESKENLEDNNVSQEEAKPSTSNNNSNHKNNSTPSERSWESPASNSTNSGSNSTWQESQDIEENVTEEIEVLEEEDTEPVVWTLEEMLSNNAWVSVVDGSYFAIIGEEQQEITEEVAITLGYEPEVDVEAEEPADNDFMETYRLAMHNKGIERLPLNDPESEWKLVAQPDYEEASDQLVASNTKLDAFSGQKILAFSVLGFAAVMLIIVYIVKRRRA